MGLVRRRYHRLFHQHMAIGIQGLHSLGKMQRMRCDNGNRIQVALAVHAGRIGINGGFRVQLR